MRIIHTTPDRAKRAARDHRLSFKARGLLAELLSYDDGDDITVDKLVAICREAGGNVEKTYALRAAMKELETVGYVVRQRGRNAAGEWWSETTVYGSPWTRLENRSGLDQGEPDVMGQTKPRTDTPDQSSESQIQADMNSDPGNWINSDSHKRRSDPGVITRHGLSAADSPPLIDVRAETDQSQDLNVAPMGGDKPTTNPVEAVPARRGEAEDWPTVALIPGSAEWESKCRAAMDAVISGEF